LIDDLIISFCRNITPKDFAFKKGKHGDKKGKRQYLGKEAEKLFTSKLDSLFKGTVEIPRKNLGKRQEIESLINKEAQLLAKYLRGERANWDRE